MRRKFLVALVLLGMFGFAMAQEKKDAFVKAVDYCNCKVTYAYLNQFTSSLAPGHEDKVAFEKIKAGIGNCEIGKSIGYDKLAELMNNNHFGYSNRKISLIIDGIKEKYNDNLTKDDALNKIIGGIYSNESLEATVSKYTAIGDVKDALINDLTSYFTEPFASPGGDNSGTSQKMPKKDPDTELTPSDVRDMVRELEVKVNANTISAFSLNWPALLISLILIVVLGFILIRQYADLKEGYKELKDRVDRYRGEMKLNSDLSDKPISQNQFQGGNAKELSGYKKSIEDQLEGMQRLIDDVRTEIEHFKRSQKDELISSNFQSYRSQASEVFFASIPNKDGSFNINSVTSSINPTASFYKFTITDSRSQKASFEFLNEERAIKDATNAPERILRPVCKIINALNQNAKRIRTVTHGKVVKQNDRWILDSPAEIEYE